ncbi:S-adenosyl-L-methionine-dependent methyltransferase, partial [Aureobasidium sp. EXF-3399]
MAFVHKDHQTASQQSTLLRPVTYYTPGIIFYEHIPYRMEGNDFIAIHGSPFTLPTAATWSWIAEEGNRQVKKWVDRSSQIHNNSAVIHVLVVIQLNGSSMLAVHSVHFFETFADAGEELLRESWWNGISDLSNDRRSVTNEYVIQREGLETCVLALGEKALTTWVPVILTTTGGNATSNQLVGTVRRKVPVGVIVGVVIRGATTNLSECIGNGHRRLQAGNRAFGRHCVRRHGKFGYAVLRESMESPLDRIIHGSKLPDEGVKELHLALVESAKGLLECSNHRRSFTKDVRDGEESCLVGVVVPASYGIGTRHGLTHSGHMHAAYMGDSRTREVQSIRGASIWVVVDSVNDLEARLSGSDRDTSCSAVIVTKCICRLLITLICCFFRSQIDNVESLNSLHLLMTSHEIHVRGVLEQSLPTASVLWERSVAPDCVSVQIFIDLCDLEKVSAFERCARIFSELDNETRNETESVCDPMSFKEGRVDDGLDSRLVGNERSHLSLGSSARTWGFGRTPADLIVDNGSSLRDEMYVTVVPSEGKHKICEIHSRSEVPGRLGAADGLRIADSCEDRTRKEAEQEMVKGRDTLEKERALEVKLNRISILVYMETCHGINERDVSERRSARSLGQSEEQTPRARTVDPVSERAKRDGRVREDWRGLRQRSLGEPFFSLWKLLLSYTNVVSKCPFKASALFFFLYLWSGPCPVNTDFVATLTLVHRLSRKPALTQLSNTLSTRPSTTLVYLLQSS